MLQPSIRRLPLDGFVWNKRDQSLLKDKREETEEREEQEERHLLDIELGAAQSEL